ncbi:MAG: DUF504 domain-containing protein [Betaproteobacteria bacterium]|nr:DUF504 domain-containing protein [Betaproteobacteria bacterium]
MIPIRRLLSRIQWDSEFAKGDFVLGYYDRVEAKIRRVPLHRVREVLRDGELIWKRDAVLERRRWHPKQTT